MSFSKILIANRGEIACRVMRTAHRLGYRTVAVYSQADANAPHVLMADEAVCIGPAPAAQSYLNMQALLDAAERTGADALHPGYGFLSERAAFAQACVDAGLVFIGPPASAINAMGDKAGAKRRMLAAGVPCVPGYSGEDGSDERLVAEAQTLGVPLLVKAVSGGGGRGIRRVQTLAELPAALAAARREAESAFGDGNLMLERWLPNARHVEIQIFADSQGRVVHLGERDCTAQRRRQKLIEESPSPSVSPALREAMGAAAVAAARAVDYRGAGTVEFILDEQGQYYFLEMNTRLQVEHPVTECVTGLDLVEWQLRVAAGEPLPLRQDQIRWQGHAIEVRLVAEDPYEQWAPQTGRILSWRPGDAGLRVDDGISADQDLPPYYDAMVAKFIAHGRDRADAVRNLTRALENTPLIGLRNNGRFLRDLLQHPAFAHSTLTTTRLDEWAEAGNPLLQRPAPPGWAWPLAAAAWVHPGPVASSLAATSRAADAAPSTGGPLPWSADVNSSGTAKSPARPPPRYCPASVSGYSLTLACLGEQQTLRLPLPDVEILSLDAGWLRARVEGVTRRLPAWRDTQALYLVIDAACHVFTEPSPYPQRLNTADPAQARAPATGLVAQVLVQVGDRVSAGQSLASVEAMKMEMWVNAAAAGTVRAVLAQPKMSVAAGALLVELEIDDVG